MVAIVCDKYSLYGYRHFSVFLDIKCCMYEYSRNIPSVIATKSQGKIKLHIAATVML
jgi:hypothetical protein